MVAVLHKQMLSPVYHRTQSWAPLLYLAFINDLSDSVSHSDPRLFADDCLLYRLVKTDNDARRLQEDLDALEEWETKWQMKFHPEKCQVIRININKRFEYRLHGHTLEVVDSGKYLGVHLTNDLTWHKHVDATVAKASKTLGFLRRNLSECTTHVKSAAYTSLVRPTLEYSSAVSDPSSTDINKLEKVQRQAARFVHSNYFDRTPGYVSKMVLDLGWEPLKKRRQFDRLTTLYKIQRGLVETYTGDIVGPNDKRTRGQQRLYQPTATVTVYKNSFPRAIREWNLLPINVTDAATLEEFRVGLGTVLPTL